MVLNVRPFNTKRLKSHNASEQIEMNKPIFINIILFKYLIELRNSREALCVSR